MSQSGLGDYARGLAKRPSRFDLIERLRDAITGVADDLGVPLDYFAVRGGELDPSTGVLRYQYSTVYEFPTDHPNDPNSSQDYDLGTVQFRTTLYTLSDPSGDVKDHLRDVTHRRLHALFDTGEYDSYMSGFNFVNDSSSEESGRVVGHDEVPPTGLGVPNYSVEVYDEDGTLAGYSRGYATDFGVSEVEIESEDAPAQEVWRVQSFNEARGDYQVAPPGGTPARQRARGASGKTAYVNGLPVGSITERGRVWMSKAYERPWQATYQSRQQVIESTGTPYQALSPGAKLYKVQESPSGVYFSTVEPTEFDPEDPDDIDPEGVGILDREDILDLDDDEPTTFVVLEDVAETWAMGKYSPPVVRDIEHGVYFTIYTPGGR